VRFGVVSVVTDGVAELHDGVVDAAFLEKRVAGVSCNFGALAVHIGAHQIGSGFALGGGFGGMVFLCQHGGEGEVGIGLLRKLPDSFLQRGFCLGKPVKVIVYAAQRRPAIAVLGAEFKRGVQLAGGIFVSAGLQIEDAEDVGRLGRGGVELLGGLKLGDGAGGIVLHLEGEAEIVVQAGRIGVELERGVQLVDGVGELAELDVGCGEVLVSGDVVRGEDNGLLEEGNGVFSLLDLAQRHAQVDESVGVLRVGGDDLAEKSDGLRDLSRALEGEGELILGGGR
jgi:hypothetical protein